MRAELFSNTRPSARSSIVRHYSRNAATGYLSGWLPAWQCSGVWQKRFQTEARTRHASASTRTSTPLRSPQLNTDWLAQMSTASTAGQSLRRGKVHGDFFAPGMLYAVVASGSIAHGEISSIDTHKAMRVPGASGQKNEFSPRLLAFASSLNRSIRMP